MKHRTFEISQSSGMEVTKKEATCFIHQLARDASKPQSKQLYKWRRDTNAGADAGPSAFCSDGLTEGSLIKLCAITENGQQGVQFAFFKNGELWYACREFGGDSANDMHLSCLHKMVAKVVHTAQPEVTPTSHTKEKFTMTTPQKCTLTIACADGDEVTKQQHICFVHNLIADISKPKPLIQWRRSNSKDGIVYCSNGLSEGTLMTLRMLTDTPGVEFTYSRHGKLLYSAVETNGDVNCKNLAHLLHKVTCAVTLAEPAQKQNSLEDMMQLLNLNIPEPEEPTTKVADIFKQITADRLVEYLFENGPNMLTVGVVKGSPLWIQRENMVRAVVAYLQNVPRKDNGLQLIGFGLKRLSDGKIVGNLHSDSLTRVANASVKFLNSPYYVHLKPTEAVLKFAADVVIKMLTSI